VERGFNGGFLKKTWLIALIFLVACEATGKVASPPYPKDRDKVVSFPHPKNTDKTDPSVTQTTIVFPSSTIVATTTGAPVGTTGSTTSIVSIKPTTTIPTTTIPAATTTTKPTPTTTGAPTTTTSVVKTVRVVDFGATPNDLTDDQSAIQRAFDNAPVGYTVVFDPGTYLHSSYLVMNQNNVSLSGYGATLTGTSPTSQALIVRGDGVTIAGISIANVVNGRLAAEEHMGISLSFTDKSIVKDVTVDGASAAGIFAWEATNYIISNNVVKNTLSDGIHSTGNSKFGVVQSNQLTNVGDDCFAVVGYGAELPSNITIQNNTCSGGKARGVSVVGGKDILIQNNSITRSAAAGIYLASESSYSTNRVTGVEVTGNTLTEVNTNASIDHGGIFIWGRLGFVTDDITIEDNTITNTVAGPAHITSFTSYVTNLRFINNQSFGSKQHRYIETSSYTMSGDLHNGVIVSL
jgi:parallel beta-helix repeat protein